MRYRTSVALIATSSLLAMASADAASAAPAGSTVVGLQSKVAAIASQISSDNAASQIAAERFDEANVRFDRASTTLATLKVQLAADRAREREAVLKVRQVAVASYVLGDSTSAQYGAVLTKGVADIGTVAAYAGAATGSLHEALVSLQLATTNLTSGESRQRATVASAQTDVAAAANARQSALQAAAQQKAALGQVKGSLASALAAQARAEAEAAARRAAAARAAQQASALAAAQEQAQAAALVAAAAAQASPDSSTAADAAAASASATDATMIAPIAVPIVSTGGTSAAGNAAVAAAEQYLGVPYVWGGASVAGFDCSGLTMVAWGAAGVKLDHSAYYQYQETKPVSMSALRPGDLLFYHFANDGTDPVTHVAMYVGNNQVIQAPETGQQVSYHALYTNGLVGAGRP
ncbi:MAG TPA: C40 family peptidase [Acidimicrobiales bacterium]|jgi:cell wall-associated NlpC family hydrolase|nr:C40 family peptidase [Acidimicrobiales bacterium]